MVVVSRTSPGQSSLLGIVQPTQLEEGVVQIHLLRRIFVHRADVEGGQHVEVGDAGRGQPLQVAHRSGVGGGEGEIFAAMGLGRAGVSGAEVADVPFVDDGGLRRQGREIDAGVPALRLQVRGVDVHELRSERPRIGAYRVGIPGFPHQNLAFARVVGRDDVAVVAPVPAAAAVAATPDAGVGVQTHVEVGAEHQGAVGAGVVQAQLHVLRGWRPHGSGDGVVGVDGAQRRFVGVLVASGVESVQHGRQLQLGAELVAVGIFADDPQLLRQQFLDALRLQVQRVGRIVRQVRRPRQLFVHDVDGRQRRRQLAANDNAAHAAVGLIFRFHIQGGLGGGMQLHVGQFAIPENGAGIDPMRRLILHGQGRRLELLADVVDAERLSGRPRFAQLVLRQGGIHHHPVHVAVGIGGVFGEVDAQIHRLRRTGIGVDDEVAAHRVLLQLQHPIGAVDRIDAAVQVVLIVRRRAVRPAGAGALVAVVHGAVRPAQRHSGGIPAAGFAAVVPQVQHPAAEALVAAVVVDDRFVRAGHILGRGLVRHDAASAHGHLRRLALRRRRRPALAVVQNHLVAGARGKRRLIAPGAAATGSKQGAGEDRRSNVASVGGLSGVLHQWTHKRRFAQSNTAGPVGTRDSGGHGGRGAVLILAR